MHAHKFQGSWEQFKVTVIICFYDIIMVINSQAQYPSRGRQRVRDEGRRRGRHRGRHRDHHILPRAIPHHQSKEGETQSGKVLRLRLQEVIDGRRHCMTQYRDIIFFPPQMFRSYRIRLAFLLSPLSRLPVLPRSLRPARPGISVAVHFL